MAERTMTATAVYGTSPLVLADGALTPIPATILEGLTVVPADRVRVAVRTPHAPIIIGVEAHALYVDYVISLGPKLYLRFGEASGDPQDSSGNEHHCTSSTALTYSQTGAISGDSNKAIAFNGSTSYTKVLDHDDIDPDYDEDFTWTLWAKMGTNDSGDKLVSKQSATVTPYQVYYNAAHGIGLARHDGTHAPVASSAIAVNDNAYHLIAGRKTGSLLDVLVGATFGTPATDTTDTTVTNASSCFFGVKYDGSPWTGTMDEIAYFDRALTDAELLTMRYLGTLSSPW